MPFAVENLARLTLSQPKAAVPPGGDLQRAGVLPLAPLVAQYFP